MAPKILLIETSSHRCDVAIAEGKTLLAECGSLDPKGYQHAEKLHVYLQEVLAAANLRVSDLDGIAVSAGPGSYTGLRIGVASAKGLAQPHALPILAYSSLEALGQAARELRPELGEHDRIWAAMDARRMEVYSAVFSGNGERLSPDAPQLLEEVPMHATAEGGQAVFGVGDGVAKAMETWPDLQNLSIEYASARHGIPMALRAFEAKDFSDTAALTPTYLKAYRAGSPKLGLPNT